MREFRQLETNVIHESPTNPRRSFSEASLDELTASVRRHGVLQPILVRPNGDGFVLIAGARRLRAAKLAGCTTVPARVLELDDAAADEATIIENLHRENVHPLDEGVSYQRLVSAGRTIEDIAAALGKSKGYIYQRISLTRLVPKVQELLARDVLPLVYALKIAVVPAEQQEEALAQCFRPLFRDEEARRDQLEPLAQLTTWIEKSVRLNPRSEDTQVLLPALAEQVVSAEQERDASVLALSTLHAGGDPFAVVELADATFSTSGDYERFFVKDGVRYHHILDPKTGEPARGCRSVTIVAREAVWADGLSTGVFILGPERGMALVERLPDVEAVIVTADNQVLISTGLVGRVEMRHSPTP